MGSSAQRILAAVAQAEPVMLSEPVASLEPDVTERTIRRSLTQLRELGRSRVPGRAVALGAHPAVAVRSQREGLIGVCLPAPLPDPEALFLPKVFRQMAPLCAARAVCFLNVQAGRGRGRPAGLAGPAARNRPEPPRFRVSAFPSSMRIGRS